LERREEIFDIKKLGRWKELVVLRELMDLKDFEEDMKF